MNRNYLFLFFVCAYSNAHMHIKDFHHFSYSVRIEIYQEFESCIKIGIHFICCKKQTFQYRIQFTINN